jgi:rod shape-determining protein MreD
MKLMWVLATIAVAIVLQVTLARYAVGGRWVFDLVLVGVLYAALQWGPVAGMVAGTLGGLAQDVLENGIVGVGGLVKTLVGFAAGAIGTQFVIARAQARMVIVAIATIVHRVLLFGIVALIEQQWPSLPWTAMLWETAMNTLFSVVAFAAAEAMPGLVARGRESRRSSFSRRQW